VVVCAKLLTTFFLEVVVAVTSLFFFLNNDSGNVTLKVTIARHWIYSTKLLTVSGSTLQ